MKVVVRLQGESEIKHSFDIRGSHVPMAGDIFTTPAIPSIESIEPKTYTVLNRHWLSEYSICDKILLTVEPTEIN